MGIMHQPERNCSLLTTAAIPHALGEGHRALRAPASASVPSADSQTPGVKSGGGSLRLSRRRCSRRLPQPVARAAAASGDDASGDRDLAHVRKLPGLHPRKDIRPIAQRLVVLRPVVNTIRGFISGMSVGSLMGLSHRHHR